MLDWRILWTIFLHNCILFCDWSYLGSGRSKGGKESIYNHQPSCSYSTVSHYTLPNEFIAIPLWRLHVSWNKYLVSNREESFQQARFSSVDHWFAVPFFSEGQAYINLLLHYMGCNTVYSLPLCFGHFLSYNTEWNAFGDWKVFCSGCGVFTLGILHVEWKVDNGSHEQQNTPVAYKIEKCSNWSIGGLVSKYFLKLLDSRWQIFR